MKSIRLQPSGVVLADNGYYPSKQELQGKLIVSKPNKEIIELYNNIKAGVINIDSFEAKQKLLKITIPLYGNFYRWLKYQLTQNRFVHGLNQEFLIDTLKYIKTGSRSLHLMNWEALLSEYPDTINSKELIHDAGVLKWLDDGKDERMFDYISQWTSHKDGVWDMVCTSYLLFGKYAGTVK